jgi:hypothetical protein
MLDERLVRPQHRLRRARLLISAIDYNINRRRSGLDRQTPVAFAGAPNIKNKNRLA